MSSLEDEEADKHEFAFTLGFKALFCYYCFFLMQEGEESKDGTFCWASPTKDAIASATKEAEDQINVSHLIAMWFMMGFITTCISIS